MPSPSHLMGEKIPGLEITNGLLDFLRRIHDERAVARDGLPDRPTGDQNGAPTRLARKAHVIALPKDREMMLRDVAAAHIDAALKHIGKGGMSFGDRMLERPARLQHHIDIDGIGRNARDRTLYNARITLNLAGDKTELRAGKLDLRDILRLDI